ncbi:hypothetical protein [Bufonid herpesvirus 1]|uniref:hypothetical protein n=1 Tax=Bufonid herpesvirus 1 TaxID=2282206 RepID=UPI000EB6A0E4|nr:hypothetical protein [Bufonid herpesvirus 1]AXF48641.1 hypothetical protein [Bufonid herpesvirus 1]
MAVYRLCKNDIASVVVFRIPEDIVASNKYEKFLIFEEPSPKDAEELNLGFETKDNAAKYFALYNMVIETLESTDKIYNYVAVFGADPDGTPKATVGIEGLNEPEKTTGQFAGYFRQLCRISAHWPAPESFELKYDALQHNICYLLKTKLENGRFEPAMFSAEHVLRELAETPLTQKGLSVLLQDKHAWHKRICWTDNENKDHNRMYYALSDVPDKCDKQHKAGDYMGATGIYEASNGHCCQETFLGLSQTKYKSLIKDLNCIDGTPASVLFRTLDYALACQGKRPLPTAYCSYVKLVQQTRALSRCNPRHNEEVHKKRLNRLQKNIEGFVHSVCCDSVLSAVLDSFKYKSAWYATFREARETP